MPYLATILIFFFANSEITRVRIQDQLKPIVFKNVILKHVMYMHAWVGKLCLVNSSVNLNLLQNKKILEKQTMRTLMK